MATTHSVSRKSKRRADSMEGQPLPVSAPSVARPAKKRKLEETDALDAGALTSSSRTYPTTRTRRRSEEVTRHRQRARLLQRASTRVQIQLDKPRSPSPVALPTPSSVKEECVEEDDTGVAENADDKLTKLRAELAAKDRIIDSYVKSLQALQNLSQCQVCLEPMQKPFALVPCGHTSCLSCLQSWFKTQPPNMQEGDPVISVSRRKKTCPQCRSVVTQRPVGVFLIRDFANHVETMLSTHEGRPPAVPPQEESAGVDPWEGIFPAFTNHAADGAIIDEEDGGVRRCPVCTWEIFGGFCEGCGREFDEELDEDGEQFFMPPLGPPHEYHWYHDPVGPPPYPFYARIGDYDEDEYDTPAEFDMDEYDGSFISDEDRSRDGTPQWEVYEDARSERSHSSSRPSNYSGHSNRSRRQSIDLEDPVYRATVNWISSSDSEGDGQGQRDDCQVTTSDHEDDDLVHEEDGSHYGSD